MFKRLAALLLGIGLIGLGVLLFVAPGGTIVMQWLTRLWPTFLILGGLVRVAGYLIDRHPRSPVGGVMITAVGGILLAANFRGERSLLQLLGQYWFWALLALILGRLLRQYTHRPEDGPRPQTFSFGAIVLMILLVGGGLTANYLVKNRQYLSGIEFKLGGWSRFGIFGGEFAIEDEPGQEVPLLPGMRVLINNFKGDIEVTAIPQAAPSARLVKHVRANTQEEAAQVAKNLHLQLTAAGNSIQFSVKADGVSTDFRSTLIVTLPSQTYAGIEASDVTGQIKFRGLRGNHILRNADRVEIADNSGKITVENPRGQIELNQIQGDVNLANTRGTLSLNEITGAVMMDASGGNITVEQSSGPIQARVSNVRLTINEIAGGPGPAANNQPVLKLLNASNSRLDLREIQGAVSVNADHSRIEVEDILGDLTVKTSSERVQVARVTGTLKIKADNSTVEIEEIRGAAEIEATHDVTVRGFHGPLNVTTDSGTINLATDEKLEGNLKATSEQGRIRISLPEDSGFKLNAGTERGRIRLLGFDGLNVPNRQKEVALEHNASPTAPTVLLRSAGGNIELHSSGLAVASRDEE